MLERELDALAATKKQIAEAEEVVGTLLCEIEKPEKGKSLYPLPNMRSPLRH